MAKREYHTVRTSRNKVLSGVINEALSSKNALLYACAIEEQGITPEDWNLYSEGRQEVESQTLTGSSNKTSNQNALVQRVLSPYLDSSSAREPIGINTQSTSEFSRYLIEGIRDSLQYESFKGVEVSADVTKVGSGSASATYELKASFEECVDGAVFPVTCKYQYEQDHNDREDTPESVVGEFLGFQESEVREALHSELELSFLEAILSGNSLVVQLKEPETNQ